MQTREVRLQADINHRSSSQLTALSAACERGSALDGRLLQAVGSGPAVQDSSTLRSQGTSCARLLLQAAADCNEARLRNLGTWEPEGQLRSEKASWSFHNFHPCAPLVNNHGCVEASKGCSMLAVAARCTAPDQGGANAEWPSAF